MDEGLRALVATWRRKASEFGEHGQLGVQHHINNLLNELDALLTARPTAPPQLNCGYRLYGPPEQCTALKDAAWVIDVIANAKLLIDREAHRHESEHPCVSCTLSTLLRLRCVNSHDEVLAALKGKLGVMRDVARAAVVVRKECGIDGGGLEPEDVLRWADEIEAILAKG